MSTYKRSTGNIVFQTLEANSSVSFIGPTANAVSVVINGDLSVSGNASLTGNIAGDKIFNGTSSIEIQQANGNANISIGGVSNVLVVANNGISVAGNANVTGNASVGNLSVGGVIAGNVTFGNLSTPGNITISRDASVGQPTFRFNDTDTTININTVIGAVEWFTNDAAGARVTTAVRSIATSVTGNARYEVLTSTNGAAATAKFVIDDVGNVGVANTAPLHTFAVSGNTFTSGTATVIGNVTGGNFITAGLVSSTGNITSAANIAGGNLVVTSNVTANNLSATTGISAGVGGITATGNIRGGNLISDGVISATGNLTTTDIFATTLTATGNVRGANLNVGGVANAGSVTATSTISATGNVTGGNVNTAGRVSATANIVGGNIVSPGIVSSAGNIVTGAYFLGDGGFLSNVTAAANSVATKIQSGTTEVGISTPNGNIVATVGATSNVIVVSTNTFAMTGAITASGNITGGNINTAGVISATGNITGGNVSATFGNFNTVIGAANASNLTTGTVSSDRLSGSYVINITGFAGTVSAASQPNITSVGTLTSLSVSGNVTGGNLRTGGLISATGNITGGNLSGTSIVGTLTTAAQNNITSVGTLTELSVSGNVTGSGGATFSTTITGGDLQSFGNITCIAAPSAGNISAGNLILGGGIFDSSQLDIQTTAANANIVLTPNGTGNVNIGRMSASGNIRAVAFYGNGAPLSSITGANVTGTVASATTAGTVTTAAQPNITSVGTLTSLSSSGNITGGNINTAGLVSATGNVQGGNLVTAGLITATGNVTGNYILGNGALLTGVITSVANINLGNSNVTVRTSGGNISVGVGGTSNVVVWATTGQFTTGLISATGNIQTGDRFIGSGAGLTSIPGANVTGTVANATFATSAGSATSATSATTAGTVTANAQPNITSVGTLSSLAVTANITAGNLSVSTGTVSAGNILNTNANGVGNIGSSTIYFNRVFATATTALYADLAEKFLADQLYAPGTVLIFGGEQEVTQSVSDLDHRVAGVVSTNPSYIMNSGLDGNYAVELALQGRVPCHVVGPVEKGDLLVSAADGRARAVKSAPAGTIIGKSLQNFSGTTGIIEIVVGRD